MDERQRNAVDDCELDQLPGTGKRRRRGSSPWPNWPRQVKSRRKCRQPPHTAAQKLKLDGVAMRMAEERVPAIFGDITNAGDRAIVKLRLAVTWYQGHGKSLKVVQREEHSIVITPIEFTDFSRR